MGLRFTEITAEAQGASQVASVRAPIRADFGLPGPRPSARSPVPLVHHPEVP